MKMKQRLKWFIGGFLCLFLTPLSMLAQSEPNDDESTPDSVDVIARWILNDEGVYRVTTERYDIQDSITVDSFENAMLCYVKVADSSANHYVLDISLKNDPNFKKYKLDLTQLEDLSLLEVNNLLCRVKTTDLGAPQEILNWDELKKNIEDFYPVLEKVVLSELEKKMTLDNDNRNAITEKLKEHVMGDAFIKKDLFGGLLEMNKYHGLRYVIDSLFEYTDTTEYQLNLMGTNLTVNFPWACQRFYSVDTNNIILVEDIRNLDVEGYIQDFIAKMKASEHPSLAQETPEQIADGIRAQNLERQISSKHYIDADSGWAILVIDKDYFKQDNKSKVKLRIVELIDNDEEKKTDEKN